MGNIKENTLVNFNWCKLIRNEMQCPGVMTRGSCGIIKKARAGDELFKMLVIKLELVIKIRNGAETGAYAQG